MISLDTVKLHISDYSIKPDNRLTIQPASVVNDTGELIGDYRLFNQQYGSKAFRNFDNGLSISIKPKGDNPFLFVQWSPGRVINQDNYKPVTLDQVRESFKIAEDSLKETGINTDIMQSHLSRTDIKNDIHTSEKPYCYFPVLAHCDMKRAEKRDYGTTLNFINSRQEICIYDKLEEMRLNKKDTAGLPDTIRIEHRLLRASKIKDFYGYNTPAELLTVDGYQRAKEKYVQALKENIFRHDTSDIEFFTQSEIETDLLNFKNLYGRMFLSAFVKAKGYQHIINHCSVDVFLSAIKSVAGIKNNSVDRKVKRYRREIKKMQFDLSLLESDMFNINRSNVSLYNELKTKALLVA